ncbi:Hypothetical protein CINCED_3A023429 [Cinara cedri]|nr:Hypothetical protein CINCED_3A023429 [Cinara cedri]
MEKFEWINPDNHSIAVDDQKQPVTNENGDLIVLDNETGKCIAVPNSEEVLEIFGFGYATSLNGSGPGSPKGSSDHDIKPIVQVVVTDSDQLLWSMRTPCQKDIEATREMLALVGSKRYQDMFNDQCTVKIRVWKRICEELMSKGYRIADSINEGGIKCHQKWRNLEKSYRNYLISATDPSNTAPKKPPPYFEALHEILKRKKKYANASAYAHTLMMDEQDIVDSEEHGSDHDDSTVRFPHQVNNSNQIENYVEDGDGTNDDHCYVVNSSGHVSKRLKVDPLAVCTTGSAVSSISTTTSPRAKNLVPSSKQQQNLPDALEHILEQMVRLHRDTLSVHQRHFNRVEKLMKDNAAQTRRLADVMGQLLHNSRIEESGGGGADKNNKPSAINAPEPE